MSFHGFLSCAPGYGCPNFIFLNGTLYSPVAFYRKPSTEEREEVAGWLESRFRKVEASFWRYRGSRVSQRSAKAPRSTEETPSFQILKENQNSSVTYSPVLCYLREVVICQLKQDPAPCRKPCTHPALHSHVRRNCCASVSILIVRTQKVSKTDLSIFFCGVYIVAGKTVKIIWYWWW